MLKFLKIHPKAIIPKYQTKGSAGFDFHAIVDENCPGYELGYGTISLNKDGLQIEEQIKEHILIPSMSQQIIRTGLCCCIPKGYEIQVRPRSGLAFKHCITITNSPGTIDESFIGKDDKFEIKIALFNLGKNDFRIFAGDRIAQGVLNQATYIDIMEVDKFTEEELKNNRGGGYGSTLGFGDK